MSIFINAVYLTYFRSTYQTYALKNHKTKYMHTKKSQTIYKSFRNRKKIQKKPNKLYSPLLYAGFFQTHSCKNAFCQLSEEFDVITKELP